VDLLEDVDRFAVSSEKVALIAGDSPARKWDGRGQKSAPYGDKGGDLRGKARTGPSRSPVWGDEMAMLGARSQGARGGDRPARGPRPAEKPLIPDWGRVRRRLRGARARKLAAMLPEGEQEIAARLKGALERRGAARGRDRRRGHRGPTGWGPVGRRPWTIWGARSARPLSIGRLKAQSDGDEKLAELLELARVSPHGGRFSIGDGAAGAPHRAADGQLQARRRDVAGSFGARPALPWAMRPILLVFVLSLAGCTFGRGPSSSRAPPPAGAFGPARRVEREAGRVLAGGAARAPGAEHGREFEPIAAILPDGRIVHTKGGAPRRDPRERDRRASAASSSATTAPRHRVGRAGGASYGPQTSSRSPKG